MADKKYGELLYDMLPPLYKAEDAKIRPAPFPLKRFMQVAGTGLDFLDAKTTGHMNLFDVDKTPAELLPHLAQMMGLDFPYDMTESEQRSFLKTLPTMYKYKGTARVFDYLGQVIFGEKTRVETVFRQNTDPTLGYTQSIDILIQVTGSTTGIPAKADRYRKFAELFRPINTKINPVVQSFYTDVFEVNRNGDDVDSGYLTYSEADAYLTSRWREVEGNTLLLNFELDSYNKVSLSDAPETVYITYLPETDAYTNTILDAHEDYSVNIGAILNTALLNGTMILNSKPGKTKI